MAIGSAQNGSPHDKIIFDESRVVKPSDTMVLRDLGYLGAGFKIPIKKPRKKVLSKEDKAYKHWPSGLCVEREACHRTDEKFRIFADITVIMVCKT
ncbi:MAG: hypothetical protein JKY17_01835 [Magnetovibrio sp.]|nr:hypothetical protein [Magnetovibrio sp.]